MTAWVKSLAGSTVLSAVLIALAAPVASAQVPAAATTQAQTAFLGTAFITQVSGREVWISKSDGSRVKARIGRIEMTGLTVTPTNGQGQLIRFDDITRIQRVSHRVRTGVIVGLSIGAGFGAIGLGFCDGDGGCASGFLLAYAGIGAGIGALSGAIRNGANKENDRLYDQGYKATTVALAPIVSRTRKGAAVSITWR